ncbi:MAG: hypothetical protein ACRDCC_08440 [Culicoidibacterales bacterium]
MAKKENLLRTGTLKRAIVFYLLIILAVTILLPIIAYIIVSFFETFDIASSFIFSITDIITFLKNSSVTSEFMLASYGLISLLYWAIYMNALIRARMLRNKDGNPEAAGNKEYGSSYFLDIEDPEICDFSCASTIVKTKKIQSPQIIKEKTEITLQKAKQKIASFSKKIDFGNE